MSPRRVCSSHHLTDQSHLVSAKDLIVFCSSSACLNKDDDNPRPLWLSLRSSGGTPLSNRAKLVHLGDERCGSEYHQSAQWGHNGQVELIGQVEGAVIVPVSYSSAISHYRAPPYDRRRAGTVLRTLPADWKLGRDVANLRVLSATSCRVLLIKGSDRSLDRIDLPLLEVGLTALAANPGRDAIKGQVVAVPVNT